MDNKKNIPPLPAPPPNVERNDLDDLIFREESWLVSDR